MSVLRQILRHSVKNYSKNHVTRSNVAPMVGNSLFSPLFSSQPLFNNRFLSTSQSNPTDTILKNVDAAVDETLTKSENEVLDTPKAKEYTWVKQKTGFKRAANVIQELERSLITEMPNGNRIPEFRAGDAIEVTYRLSRSTPKLAVARGVVLGKRNKHISSSFKLLCVVDGFTVEYDFPLYNPMITDIRVLQAGFVNRSRNKVTKRAKLFYLRDLPQRKYLVTLENTGNAPKKTKNQKKKKKSKKKAKKKA